MIIQAGNLTSLLRYLLLIPAMLLCESLHAQGNGMPADSLPSLPAGISGSDRLFVLDTLFDHYLRRDPRKAHPYALLLKKEAEKQGDEKYRAAAFHNMGLWYNYNGEYFKAEEELKEAAAILQKRGDTTGLAAVYKALAGTYFYTNRYSKAIDLSFRALRIFEQEGDQGGVISSLNNIGMLYKVTGDYAAALKNYRKALAYISRYMPEKNRAFIYENMGVVYKKRHMPDSALYYYKRALRENIKDPAATSPASLFFNIGNLYAFYLSPPRIDSAKYYYDRARDLAEQSNPALLTDIYGSLGKMYQEQGQFEKSIEALRHSLALARRQHSWESLEVAHFFLYKAYKTLKDWQRATYHLEQFTDYRDSIGDKEARIAIANLESKYENEKNKARISRMELQQAADRKIRILLLVALLLVLLVVALLLRVMTHKRKRHSLEKKILSAEKEKLDQDLRYKTRQLTSQALMMIQKNKLLDDILRSISQIKDACSDNKKELSALKRKLQKTMHAEEDWELFRNYFEELNKDFFRNLQAATPGLTASEMKLSALVKLGFNIKETASLMNISPDSVKTARHILRKKFGLHQGENLYDHLQKF